MTAAVDVWSVLRLVFSGDVQRQWAVGDTQTDSKLLKQEDQLLSEDL